MHCLIIGKVRPEPTSTAAGRRTLDLIHSLRSAGWRLTFASAAQPNAHSFDLSTEGVDTVTIRVNDSGFDTWIGSLAPDVVVFDRFMIEEQFGWRVERVCPKALRVLDTSDLHCLREARQAHVRTGAPLDLYNSTALREIAAIHRSDLTLMISEYERAVLRDTFAVPDNQIAYWPFLLPSGELPEPDAADYARRAHFVMIGGFLHPPNLDAARWCKAAIWPHIRRALPAAELHLYGSYSEAYTGELNDPRAGFRCLGRAENALATLARYRVNLAPLRFGAGLKGKIFDGFQSATPNCVTPVGAEGIAGEVDWGCGISEVPERFAEIAVQVYSDPETWQRVRLQGQRIATERFDAAHWRPKLVESLTDAMKDLEARRARNFTSRMLRHHHHRSTEFMSRWIEAKNRATD